jgi:hypothetical protein
MIKLYEARLVRIRGQLEAYFDTDERDFNSQEMKSRNPPRRAA